MVFDKEKTKSQNKNEILFIDARGIFTQVDRAHRKFSDEQIKNLGIITRLYEGDTKSLKDLIKEYEALKEKAPTIKYVEKLEEEAKANKDKTFDAKSINTKEYYQKQIDWLNERFPNGKYEDVIGLCKVSKLDGEDGIIDQDYSLNAGRYVGVVIEDDGMTEDEFKEKILSLNKEFNELSAEVAELEKEINCDINQLFKK